jgi:hypothetical protein
MTTYLAVQHPADDLEEAFRVLRWNTRKLAGVDLLGQRELVGRIKWWSAQ